MQSWRISLKEYHLMLTGYKDQLLDKYEFASVQALFNRNAQSDKIKSLADIYTRPESVRDIEKQANERKDVVEKIQRNESFFDQIESMIRSQIQEEEG
ncbi:Phage protein [Bacillus phage phBC6A51]|uniref:Phage protein n=2 Tax=Bacillus cereus TaxID=1396 RepID=Q81ER0_BACCR|nr:hypothetical protein BC1905 [Bacillus phage phBC6A51]AAP08878.1 Phage protein [Bacillus cereus ATCC 14579]